MENGLPSSSLEFPLRMNDSDTFDEIYRTYYAPLCLFSKQFIEKKDAEDIVNTLFLKLWDRQETFESYQHAQSFLYLSMKNACLDFLKVSARTGNRNHQYYVNTDYVEKNFEHEMIQSEFWAEIYREIKNLPSQCSKIIQMSYIEGMKNEEIAAELGLSLQTVKNQKVKGVKVLKEWARNSSNPGLLLLVYQLFDK